PLCSPVQPLGVQHLGLRLAALAGGPATLAHGARGGPGPAPRPLSTARAAAAAAPGPARPPWLPPGPRCSREISPEAEDEEVPQLPVMASHVFVPIDPQCIEQSPFKQKHDRASSLHRKQVFLPLGPSRYRNPPGFEGRMAKPLAEGSQCPCARDCGTDNLKAVASVAGALLLCPCLIYGAYIFLPFDAPLLPTVSARLVYTLRCATFATFPIVLGEPWAGVRALCSWSRLHEPWEIKGRRQRVIAPQHHPKSSLSEPLSASPTASPGSQPALSAFSRLIFWMSYAIGRSFRAFGFSMTFLPLLAMLLWNLYSMFVLEPENLLSLALPTPESRSKESRAKLRHWG
uniref:Transmembrane protein 79 n=1 Tax=Junco hyemalis TaxID=40217 RepID=A0A8C5ICB3_JUNHY